MKAEKINNTRINFTNGIVIITMLILSLAFFSCGDKNIEIIRKEVILKNYSVAYLHRSSNIILVQDTCYKVVFEGAENVVQDIVWQITNDTLSIKGTKNRLFEIEEIPTIWLHFKDITSLVTVKPATVINQDTLRLNYFYYYPIGEIGEAELTVDCNIFGLDNSANTLGRFYVKGRANQVYFLNRYGCSLFADKLLCNMAQVINESVGDVYMNVSETLTVYIWGTGNIYYSGNPDIKIKEKRSSGQIIRL